MTYKISNLPLLIDLETKPVLKKIASARSYLAEMKGAARSIPNENILIDTLSLQEARDSSAIENIITSQDELYQSDALRNQFKTISSKEVYHYADALRTGFEFVKDKNVISSNLLIDMQSTIVENNAGFRKLPGTELKNELTGETVYIPPQNHDEIKNLMSNLEQFVNDNSMCDWDPLIKLAVIHHQFESIHPFYDGNGRAGRILNVLYLVKEGLLDLPILYLSRYINQNKSSYYRLLQSVRAENNWEEWILFILDGIEETSLQTIKLITGINQLMLGYKHEIRMKLPKIYSQDLLNNIFRHPYTKIVFVMDELNVSRLTATRYLNELTDLGILHKQKIWKDNYYINKKLYGLLANINHV